MGPIGFGCVTRVPFAPEEFAAKVIAVEEWASFRGWGPIPGIASASFLERTPGIVGSRIAVLNTDGSRHVEEVTIWRPDVVALRMSSFSNALLARLATHFDETWSLDRSGERETIVTRSFALHPKNLAGAVVLRGVASMLRRACLRQFEEMKLPAGAPVASA